MSLYGHLKKISRFIISARIDFFFFGLKKMYDAQNLEVDHCEKGNIYGKTISIIFDNIYLRLEILARTVYIILI